MKNILLFIILLSGGIIISAQVPEAFNYQAIVRDESKNPITDQSVSFKMSILKGSITGSEEYVETHITSTNSLGLVNLVIGNGTDKTGTISAIDWGADSYFLKVEIDPAGEEDYTEMGTTQLLSVPYAMHSKTTEVYEEIQTIADAAALGNIVNAQLKNVTYPTDEQDAATKAYVDELKEIIYDELLDAGMNGVVKDVDGNSYKTIKIGNQIWMAENLKTTHYANGDAIPDGTGAGDISGETDPKYWFAYVDDLNNVTTYGRLYTWYTVIDSRNVCPDGWHVPTDTEWTTLTDYLGGTSVAGGKLKETGTTHWTTPNTGATNETGFTALPGGYRSNNGAFLCIGIYGG